MGKGTRHWKTERREHLRGAWGPSNRRWRSCGNRAVSKSDERVCHRSMVSCGALCRVSSLSFCIPAPYSLNLQPDPSYKGKIIYLFESIHHWPKRKYGLFCGPPLHVWAFCPHGEKRQAGWQRSVGIRELHAHSSVPHEQCQLRSLHLSEPPFCPL